MKPNSTSVSCIVRFHDIRYLGYLERALHSLHSQGGVSVRPIIVMQRFTSAELAAVEELVSGIWYFREHLTPKLINYVDDKFPDARSHLINLGIKHHLASDVGFLGFLDYDDILYSHAYATLTQTLIEKKAAVAFAGIEKANVIPFKNYDFVYSMSKPYKGKNKLDLLRDNFCPLHSYVINTDLVDHDQLFFREDMIRVEDYEFLTRLISLHPCDFSKLYHFIGSYFIRSDGSNTTPLGDGSIEDCKKSSIWKDNVSLLNMYKASTEVKFFASDF